jgi:hypothetical protein
MAALYVLVRAVKAGQLNAVAVMASGLICGIAAGLKLTAATYCVGMAASMGAILLVGLRLSPGQW